MRAPGEVLPSQHPSERLSGRSPWAWEQRSSRDPTAEPGTPVRPSVLFWDSYDIGVGGAPRMTEVGFPIHLSQIQFDFLKCHVCLSSSWHTHHCFNLKETSQG